MAALYPSQIRTFTNPTAIDYQDTVSHASQHSLANDEVNAIETYLGTGVQGTYSNVRTRLGSIEGTAGLIAGTVNSSAGSIDLIAGTVGSITTSSDGWTATGETWTYESSDAPTFTVTVPGTKTIKYSTGMRFKLTSGGSTQYYIMTTTPTVASGTSTLTLNGGTCSVLGTGAITDPYYSTGEVPYGFPLDPSCWIITFSGTGDYAQTSPNANEWYNIGTAKITLPIGAWDTFYEARGIYTHSGACDMFSTLSTTGTSESDTSFTISMSGAQTTQGVLMRRQKFLTIGSKTDYFLNAKTTYSGVGSIQHTQIYIQARCAYL